jgi:hypothetical protein
MHEGNLNREIVFDLPCTSAAKAIPLERSPRDTCRTRPQY